MMTKVLTLSLAVLFSSISYCHACSCMPAHPQEHYCNSDFVILAQVKKEHIIGANKPTASKVYKVRVRKEFKISEKGLTALKSGRIHTELFDSLCGVELQVGKLYVISGTISSLRARISLCNMIMEWKEVSRKQRKGLKLLYKHGCNCKIRNCMRGGCHSWRQKDNCMWTGQCETKHGICLRKANGFCMWNQDKMLTACRRKSNSTSGIRHHNRLPPRIPLSLIP